MNRRHFLGTSAALAGALLMPGPAAAQGKGKFTFLTPFTLSLAFAPVLYAQATGKFSARKLDLRVEVGRLGFRDGECASRLDDPLREVARGLGAGAQQIRSVLPVHLVEPQHVCVRRFETDLFLAGVTEQVEATSRFGEHVLRQRWQRIRQDLREASLVDAVADIG